MILPSKAREGKVLWEHKQMILEERELRWLGPFLKNVVIVVEERNLMQTFLQKDLKCKPQKQDQKKPCESASIAEEEIPPTATTNC